MDSKDSKEENEMIQILVSIIERFGDDSRIKTLVLIQRLLSGWIDAESQMRKKSKDIIRKDILLKLEFALEYEQKRQGEI